MGRVAGSGDRWEGGSWSSKQGQVKQGLVGLDKTFGLHLGHNGKPL